MTLPLSHIRRLDDGSAEAEWRDIVLRTAFQPIFALGGADTEARLVAYEGLLRVYQGEAEIAPTVFFESLGIEDRLTVEGLTRTLHILNAGSELEPDALLFVNFDPSLLSDANTVERALDDLRLAIHEASFPASRIVCEVTEQASTAPEALALFVRSLREGGFAVAIDDFGVASSDLERIEALRPDIVKFDGSWAARTTRDASGAHALAAFVERLAAEGIVTVFEGIEEGWQLQLAGRSGASMVQGYSLGRPSLAGSVKRGPRR